MGGLIRSKMPAILIMMILPAVSLAEEGNPVAIDYWQSGFTILVFVLLLVILRKTAYGAIIEGLNKRERFIRESLETAEHARHQAEKLQHEYEDKLHKAREEASAVVEEGRRDAEIVRRRIEEEARKAGDEMLSRARREIDLARDSALRAIYDEGVSLATSLAISALGRQVTPEEHQRLVMDTLRDLGRRSTHPN